jgi:hypothetical protein
MQMEVVPPQEFSCLAIVVPKFKGMLGREGDYWRQRRLATILLNKTTRFIHRHRRLNNKILVPVNLADRAKTCWLKNQTSPIQFERLTKS